MKSHFNPSAVSFALEFLVFLSIKQTQPRSVGPQRLIREKGKFSPELGEILF